ncbi:MAG: cytochrome c-type biogenesis protein CcmH [Actinomycetota bacterium]|nr:cytochrome c-type biogenesis protein CcmH [Actinomycetota bacterium]
MSRSAGGLLALLLTLLLAAAPARAIAPAERGEAFNRIERKTMCIECNVPLNIAVAPQADATRAQIRLLLERDLSEPQVLDQLVEDYGPNILASPKAEGFNALAYLVPVAVLAALLALGAFLLPRWRRGRGEGPGDDPAPRDPPSSADHERLDAELARYGA